MARATHITISTADRIRLDASQGGHDTTYDEAAANEVRQEVQVSVTYALDPGDTNLVFLAERKALEVKLAHEAVWNRIGAFSPTAFSGSNGSGSNGSGSNGSGSNGSGSNGNGPGRCSGSHGAAENEDDANEGPDDDPLAGLPHHGDDPFGGGPAGAARPHPAMLVSRETQVGRETQMKRETTNGHGSPPPSNPPQADRYMPGAPHARSGTRHGAGHGLGYGIGQGTGSPEAAPASDGLPDAEPDLEPATGPQKILIRTRANKAGLSAYALEKLLYEQFRVWRVERLTKDQAASVLVALERDLKERDLKEKEREKNGKEGSPHAATA